MLKTNNKKNKLYIIIFFMLIILLPYQKIKAHSIELDPESYISFPFAIFDGEGTITIRSTLKNYTLYWQSVEIPNANYEKIEKIKKDGEAELNILENEHEKLSRECDNIKVEYEAAYERYKNKYETGVKDEELENLEKAFDAIKTTYENKVAENNAKVQEYNNKVKEINTKTNELTPAYIEGKWIQTEDGSFKIDLSTFSGQKALAIWAKLVTSDGKIIYDEATCIMSGTQEEKIKVQGIKLDKTTVTIEEGKTYTLIPTITPENATDKLIKWTSDDEKIATVKDGKITAKAKGTATITATTNDGNYTATCKVTVSAKEDKPKDDEDKDDKDDNKTEDKNNNDTTNVKKDDTISPEKYPYTGKIKLIIGLAILLTIAIISYKKYYDYRDIK